MIKNKADESTILAQIIAKGMSEKKGHDIVIMDLRNVTSAVTDYFVICHGDSGTQVDAIAQSIEDEVIKAIGERPWHREGFEVAEWILLDYISVVAHVFLKDKRDFYGVEELWGDAEITKVD